MPSGAVGTGLGNYTISYLQGSLTVNPAPLTITAESTSKTYGQTAAFTGTEFTESGLVNGDTITGVTLSSAGAAATAAGRGIAVCDCAERRSGTGLGNYTISYLQGSLTVNPAPLTITAGEHEQDVRPDGGVHGTEFTESGLVNGDTVTGVTSSSAGAAATAPCRGIAVCDCAQRSGGHGTWETTRSATCKVA